MHPGFSSLKVIFLEIFVNKKKLNWDLKIWKIDVRISQKIYTLNKSKKNTLFT